MKVEWKWVPALVWGLLLVVLSLLPAGGGNFIFLDIPHLDKLAHAAIYAVWGFLIVRVINTQNKKSTTGEKWLVVIFASCIGILLEFGQYSLTSGRSMEVLDMVANAMGSLLGVWGPALFGKK